MSKTITENTAAKPRKEKAKPALTYVPSNSTSFVYKIMLKRR